MRERNRDGSGDGSGGTFAGVANVEQRDAVGREKFQQFVDVDATSGTDQVGEFGREPSVVVDAEITDHIVLTYPCEPECGHLLFAGVGDQHDRLAHFGHHPARLGEAPVEPHVHGAA